MLFKLNDKTKINVVLLFGSGLVVSWSYSYKWPYSIKTVEHIIPLPLTFTYKCFWSIPFFSLMFRTFMRHLSQGYPQPPLCKWAYIKTETFNNPKLSTLFLLAWNPKICISCINVNNETKQIGHFDDGKLIICFLIDISISNESPKGSFEIWNAKFEIQN